MPSPGDAFEAIYGNALGALVDTGTGEIAASRYNQVINGHFYWTQRQWSNEAGGFFDRGADGEGECVQRMLGAPFTVSANPAATVPTTFDISGSGGERPRRLLGWNFGDGEQVGSESPIVAHTYALLRRIRSRASPPLTRYGSSRGPRA